MNLTGRTVLVTGGTRGVGRALTRQLIGLGAHVVAVGRDPGHLADLTAEYGDRVSAEVVDLADPDAVDAFGDGLPARHPGLGVVINNAGVQNLGDFLTGDPRDTRQVLRRELAVNLDAVITLSTGLLPHLRDQPSAAIVNISSGLAVVPKASAPVYCAAKSAVRTFTRALRYQCEEAAPHIRVMDAVLPLVDTDMTAGRGRGKISPAEAARAVVDGIRRDRAEILVGKARLLPALMRIAPSVGYRALRHG
ncbi:SDR family oxidoreductase [Streptomyces yaizuensis]|uniref:SDR family NAD(P)-dependent oxidoreductase n=1 Tax=Streptomyces yaizuensis TaxID=2989713 RepID=A0ABQ5NR92_9ACTN|nr:SDR family NAD(P)-dependent oxidoreductase [Streptomyces sp. YSPA8]GLF92884.1 SDR family NAD(P)-dependent oxidoreductase [Streptomyces sp. YSPA8]